MLADSELISALQLRFLWHWDSTAESRALFFSEKSILNFPFRCLCYPLLPSCLNLKIRFLISSDRLLTRPICALTSNSFLVQYSNSLSLTLISVCKSSSCGLFSRTGGKLLLLSSSTFCFLMMDTSSQLNWDGGRIGSLNWLTNCYTGESGEEFIGSKIIIINEK